ncbi:MAG: TonB-dependent receptor, partial [Polyangiaceae bacterium]
MKGVVAGYRLVAASAAVSVTGMAMGARAQEDEVLVRGDSAGNFASRADERDSPRELTDAASLIEPLPGAYVRRFGGDDSFATLSIRGSSSNQVAVVLAGVPLTGGADPTLDLATLPLWPGAVATVHRSFAPAVLGPGSLGGTLVMAAPGSAAPLATDAWAAVGSFGEARLRVGDVSDLGGGARIATAVSASRADDNFSYFNPLLSGPGADVFTSQENAGHADANGLASLALPVRWSKTNEGALTVTTLAQARRQELPGTVYAPTPFASLASDRELESLELTGQEGAGAWIARAWGRRDGLHLSDAPGSAALGPTSADQTIVALGGSAGWRGRAARSMTIDARLDASSERFAPGTYVGSTSPPGARRASMGAALDTEWRPAARVTLSGSGRLDGWS